MSDAFLATTALFSHENSDSTSVDPAPHAPDKWRSSEGKCSTGKRPGPTRWEPLGSRVSRLELQLRLLFRDVLPRRSAAWLGAALSHNGATVTQERSRPLKLATATVLLAAFANPAIAYADEPRFGANDIPTAFYISKSDDHNRVDYGMRLGARCTASNSDAVFPYWREFEHAPPVRTHSLGVFEYFAYGLSGQGVHRNSESSGEYWVKLKQFGQRPIWITTRRETDGHCSALARCMIAGVKFAQLLSIYVKLSAPLSVDYVVVKGKNLDTGQLLEERLKK